MSLYKRADTPNFWCRFTVRGREIRQSTGTDHRPAAEEYETALRARYWRQVKLGETFYTFKEAGERWLLETEKKTKGKDKQIIDWFNYQRDSEGHIIETRLAPLELAQITREVIDSARAKLAEGLSKTTVNYYMSVLRAILRKARDEWGWLTIVPKVPMFKKSSGDYQWLTRPQFKALLPFLPEHTRDLAKFAVATGLRKANITGLTWDRVDLKRGTAFVLGSDAKAGVGIAVPLNTEAVALLKSRVGIHKTYCFTFQGSRVQDVATNAWRAAVKAAGHEGLRFHDLRHTWASWHVQQNTPLSIVRELGGWQSEAMLKRYAHLSPGHLKAYANQTLIEPKKRARRPK